MNYLPLEDLKNDKLGFAKQAEEIASFINNFPCNVPYAIALQGSWGTGKSSMMNFIEKHLDVQNKCEVIRFNPWLIENREGLLLALFEEINYLIRGEQYVDLKKKFASYARKIVGPVTQILAMTSPLSILAQSSSKVAEGVIEEMLSKPLSKMKKDVEKELEEMFVSGGKKIVIFIDDIDRLFPQDVVSIMKLIQASLHFPGLFFVVAFDERAVNDALQEAKILDPQKYLEKIIQKTYHLNSKYQLITLCEEFIIPSLKDNVSIEKFPSIMDNIPISEAHQDLRLALEIFVYKNHLKYVKEPEDSFVDVGGLYDQVNRILCNELDNPRVFLKFKNFLEEKWSDYHREVFSKIAQEPKYICMAFLIFFMYFFYPNETDPRIFELQSKPIPQIKHIIGFINKICPRITDNERKLLTKDTPYIQCIAILQKYPDAVKLNLV